MKPLRHVPAGRMARVVALVALVTAMIGLGIPVAHAATPSVTGFSPQSGPAGTTVVTINGSGFTSPNVTTVTFWPNRSVVPSAVTSTTVTATVPANAHTGPISVTNADGTGTSADSFVVTATSAPSITSFSPSSGATGTVVTIDGTNFDGTSAVKFNGVDASSFSFVSSLQLTATVPNSATSGPISVTTPNGTATSSGSFTVTAVGNPTITSFSPTSGPAGTIVVITGTNLIGATSVTFGNKAAASFTVNSTTQVTATVANGTQTGPITVTTPVGTATSSTEFVIGPAGAPTITSFSPTSGAVGTVVTIGGTNFSGATAVKFNVTAASTFTVVNSTQITAKVATGTTTGFISVTTPSGTAASATKFTVPGTPEITSFSPVSGPSGTIVTINGNNFAGTTSVKFDTSSAAFTVDNPNKITATVPAGATTGKISVTTPNGTNFSATNFTVGSPGITSFDPMRGPWGTSVVITGALLTGATAVRFGGTSAQSFTVDSVTQITAVVANGTVTGTISVTVPSGTLTSTDPFTVVHRRTMSLSLSRHLIASGKVVCTDGTTACSQVVPVKVQRRVNGVWRNVGTGFTDGSGNYRIPVRDKPGKYRAIAGKTSLSNGDVCRRVRSAIVVE